MWVRNWLAGWARRVMVNGFCSVRRLVTSRALQGFVLGPVLHNIFVSDPEEVAELTVFRFAAHSKTVGAIKMLGSRPAIQGDLDRLKERADRSLMKLNKDKCKILQLGRNKPYNNTSWGAALRTLPCAFEQARAEQKPAVVLAAKAAKHLLRLCEQEPHGHSPPSTQHFLDHSFRSSNTRKTLKNWSNFRRDLPTWSGPGTIVSWGETEGAGLVQPGEKTVLVRPDKSSWYLQGCFWGDGARLFKWCMAEEWETTGISWNEKSRLDIKQRFFFFYCLDREAVELPREAVSILADFKD